MSKLPGIALLIALSASPGFAAETIEAIGGEKCAGAVAVYEVEFFAHDDAAVEARVKAMVRDSSDAGRDTSALSLDGKLCESARCAFRAAKGQTYKFAAKSTGPKVDELFISVSRP